MPCVRATRNPLPMPHHSHGNDPCAQVHAGPFIGIMFLILVDAHSKWLDIHIINSATALSKMRSIFATHGLLEVLVTDNRSVFTSTEFANFTKRNGIRHVVSAPYYPASNGFAVQTFKEGIQKSLLGALETWFLFKYWITPHSTAGLSPAELLMGKQLHSHLSQMHPDVAQGVKHHQEHQKLGAERAFVISVPATKSVVPATESDDFSVPTNQ